MGRPKKEGLDYYSHDTNFFENDNIVVLIEKYGAEATALFNYILCKCYGKHGYYLIYDETFTHIAARNLKMSANKIAQIIAFLSGRSMLQKIEGIGPDSDTVIVTSAEIQKRYQEIMKHLHRDVKVKKEYWILDAEDSESFIVFSGEEVRINAKETGVNHQKSAQKKGKKTKTNDSKEKEKLSDKIAYADFVRLSPQEYQKLIEKFGEAGAKDKIEELNNYKGSSGKRYNSDYHTILSWDRKTKKEQKLNASGMSESRQKEYDDLIAEDERWLLEQADKN